MRPSSIVPCKFFAIGCCRNGDRCPFSHHITSGQSVPSQQDGRHTYIRHPNTSHIGNNDDYRGYPTMSYNERWNQAHNEGKNAIHSNVIDPSLSNYLCISPCSCSPFVVPLGSDDHGKCGSLSYYGRSKLRGARRIQSRYRWVAPNLKKDSQRQANPQIADTPLTDESPSLPKFRYRWVAPNLKKDSQRQANPQIADTPPTDESPSLPKFSSRGDSNRRERTKFPDYYYSQVESLSEDDLRQFEADSFDLEKIPEVESLSKEDLRQFEADSFDLEKIPEVPPPRCLC
uniref:Nucleoporin NUP42 n=1 Tax=Ascaris lumbricoides TaxID=6252 RepID=A0A0M3IJY0_ASCLU